MSVSSPCDICGQVDIEGSCDRCGQLVCADHFDERTGYCVECAADMSGGSPADEPDSEDLPDGVDTYRS